MTNAQKNLLIAVAKTILEDPNLCEKYFRNVVDISFKDEYWGKDEAEHGYTFLDNLIEAVEDE